jgi:hypothetical protein
VYQSADTFFAERDNNLPLGDLEARLRSSRYLPDLHGAFGTPHRHAQQTTKVSY